MQNLNISDELATKANVSNNPTPLAYKTNNLGLKKVFAKRKSMETSTPLSSEQDRSVTDNSRPISSNSLHKQNMDATGIKSGTVKTARAEAFQSKRSEKVSSIM